LEQKIEQSKLFHAICQPCAKVNTESGEKLEYNVFFPVYEAQLRDRGAFGRWKMHLQSRAISDPLSLAQKSGGSKKANKVKRPKRLSESNKVENDELSSFASPH
jgi:hypothetical protein